MSSSCSSNRHDTAHACEELARFAPERVMTSAMAGPLGANSPAPMNLELGNTCAEAWSLERPASCPLQSIVHRGAGPHSAEMWVGGHWPAARPVRQKISLCCGVSLDDPTKGANVRLDHRHSLLRRR